jgi:hypothetical protein
MCGAVLKCLMCVSQVTNDTYICEVWLRNEVKKGDIWGNDISAIYPVSIWDMMMC